MVKDEQVLQRFFSECLNFWSRQGCNCRTAYANALREVPINNPYSPQAEKIDPIVRERFITGKRNSFDYSSVQ